MRAAVVLGGCLGALAAGPSAAAPFTEAALDALLAESPKTHARVESVAELVPLLPGELRENFTFVHTSRSPFAGSISPRFPRVILFSEDARFIATFTGDPAAPGHDVLETMTFDEDRARFVLRARVLPAAGEGGRAEARAAELEAGCPRCHGTDPRPIFDAYPLWPGFYGAIQDSFPRGVPAARREHRDYLGFLATEARRGVYEGLRWVLGSPVSPYTDPRRFRAERSKAPASSLAYEPNTRLGMALTQLNRRRLHRKLSEAPGFRAQAPGLLATLLGCEDAEAPDARAVAALRTAARAENRARLERLGVDPARHPARLDMEELVDVENLARIDLIARRAGVDRADWSMALEPGALAFYDGLLGAVVGGRSYFLVEDLIFELLTDLAATEPRLRPHFVPRRTLNDYPFGLKLDLARAARACEVLSPAPTPR